MKKISFLGLFLISSLLVLSTQMQAQVKTKPKPKPKTTTGTTATEKEVTLKDGFKRLPSGLEYRIYKHGTGTKKPGIGDHIDMHILVHVKDSIIFNSRKMNENNPVPFDIKPPQFKGDPLECFMMLVAGDSAVIRISVDSLKKAGNQLLPWMKEGDQIIYNLVMADVMSPAEKKVADSIKSGKQKLVDDQLLQQYFAEHHINPLKTETGIYYTISKEGTGETGKDGWHASINYTGKFLSGKVFDSNVDTSFHHTEAFNLEIGKGKVIKGWDQGLKLLKKGSVATLYIPSTLAYGAAPRQGIPANSIMVFDVEVVDMYDQASKDDELIQEYIKTNNLKAEKTASGLYYVITKEGKGGYPDSGKTMSMNYTGKLLNGKTFDSNTDTAFHHTTSFSFELGKGRVIKGWDEGLKHFKKGGKGMLLIPSHLAYGAQERKPSIPANSVLVFDVELVDFYDQAELDDQIITKYLKEHKIDAKKTASGLYYTITKEGTGDVPKPGQKVVANYTGMLPNGTKFDSNMDTAFHHVSPFTFPLGKGQVIKGWDEGFSLLKKGSKATLFVPSGIAYGARNPSQLVPPNSVLFFDVELVDIQQ